jgi:hypothetical protein
MLEGFGLFSWHDAMERRSSRPELGLVNSCGV